MVDIRRIVGSRYSQALILRSNGNHSLDEDSPIVAAAVVAAEEEVVQVEVLVGGVNMVDGETISMMAHTTADTVVDQRKRTLLNNFWSLPLGESSRTIDREFQS